MLDFVVRPLRSALGMAERDVEAPLEGSERQLADAVDAIHRAADSLEHHVEVVEGLATAVGPLTDSVNHLTATVASVAELLAPLSTAEHEAEHVKRLLEFRRHQAPAEPPAEPSDS